MLQRAVRGHGPFVVLVEAQLALIQFTDAGLYGFKFRPGQLCAIGGLFDPLRQPRDAVIYRFDARTWDCWSVPER